MSAITANSNSDSANAVTINVPVPIPLSSLRRSAKNMRTIDPKNSVDDNKLLQSIRTSGIIQNLCAYPVGDQYEVPAGGRRFGALEYLLKAGEISGDFSVYCILIPEEEATSVSLIENYQRKAPHPADIYSAFSELLKQGRTVKTIANSHGISELEVEKYLRLGNVNKTLFKLFARDALSLDQMMAFASTADSTLQLATFKAMGEDCDARPHTIRQQLLTNRYSSESAIANFVTVEAYIEAKGVTEKDLFTDSTTLCSVSLLVELAQQKLDSAAAAISGWKWVDTSMEGPSVVSNYRRLPSIELPVPEKLKTEMDGLDEQIQALYALSDENWTEKQDEQLETLEDRSIELQEVIDRECTGFNDADKAYGGCVVTFNQNNGELEIYSGLLTKDDLKAYQTKDSSKETGSASVDATQDKTKAAISSRLADDLGLYRRSIIKSHLAASPKLAADLLHFQLCLSVIGSGHQRYCRILDISLSSVSDDTSIGDYNTTSAAKALSAIRAKLDTGWLSHQSEIKQLDAFRALSPAKRQSLVSYCVAVQLLSGSGKPGNDKLIESMIDELKISFNDSWTPNDANYFGRLTKAQLHAQGKKWFGATWLKTHLTKNKKSLVEGFHQLFSAKPDELTEKQLSVRNSWLPPEIKK